MGTPFQNLFPSRRFADLPTKSPATQGIPSMSGRGLLSIAPPTNTQRRPQDVGAGGYCLGTSELFLIPLALPQIQEKPIFSPSKVGQGI